MNNNTNILYKELSHTIIGIAMRVHTKLGAGLPEICYSRAMSLEFDDCHIPYSREFKVIVSYKDEPVGYLIPDIVVDSKIILAPLLVVFLLLISIIIYKIIIKQNLTKLKTFKERGKSLSLTTLSILITYLSFYLTLMLLNFV